MIIIVLILILVAIPTYIFSKLILKKLNIGNGINRNFTALIPTLILIPIIFAGITYLGVFYYPSYEFNKQNWEVNKEERYKMSEDIIDSKMLIGKTKVEITELLGPDFYTYNENHNAFALGFVPGLIKIDPDVLDIFFENGKVIKVGQHET